MTAVSVFFLIVPILCSILLGINIVFAPHNPYLEKNSVFECGYHSFIWQNRTQFSISFFIFALLFLLFDLEILLVYPYVVSGYTNGIYGLIIMLIFFSFLTLGFHFELGKKALVIYSKQLSSFIKDKYTKVNLYKDENSKSETTPDSITIQKDPNGKGFKPEDIVHFKVVDAINKLNLVLDAKIKPFENIKHYVTHLREYIKYFSQDEKEISSNWHRSIPSRLSKTGLDIKIYFAICNAYYIKHLSKEDLEYLSKTINLHNESLKFNIKDSNKDKLIKVVESEKKFIPGINTLITPLNGMNIPLYGISFSERWIAGTYYFIWEFLLINKAKTYCEDYMSGKSECRYKDEYLIWQWRQICIHYLVPAGITLDPDYTSVTSGYLDSDKYKYHIIDMTSIVDMYEEMCQDLLYVQLTLLLGLDLVTYFSTLDRIYDNVESSGHDDYVNNIYKNHTEKFKFGYDSYSHLVGVRMKFTNEGLEGIDLDKHYTPSA